MHPSVPASKQYLHTQRVSHKYRPFSLECHQLCIASIRHHIYGIPPSTPMAPRYADTGLGVDRIQLRAGIIPSMLLDSVPSDEIFSIEAMGSCVSDRSMACCKYRMHACLRQHAAGKIRYCVLLVRNHVFTLSQRASWRWLIYFGFITRVVLPSIICVTSNLLIFSYVSSSSRRVQTGTVSGEPQRRTISNRDMHLLRHMIIMFCVSVGGQIPTAITGIIATYTSVNLFISASLLVWTTLAALLTMIDLFLYNLKVRRYVAGFCCRCLRN